MRKVIFGINITLDGCCDHTNQCADEETHEYWTGVLREAGLLVYGRKTYELMVPFWPEVAKTQSATKALNEFARVFDSIERVVFHEHWTALKMKERGLFVRTCATKYLN